MKNENKYKYMFRKIICSEWTTGGKTIRTYHYKNYRYFRNPRTLNERKKYLKEFTRAKRKNLRTSYDDIVLSNKFTSWKDKTKRRKQWKLKQDANWRMY